MKVRIKGNKIHYEDLLKALAASDQWKKEGITFSHRPRRDFPDDITVVAKDKDGKEIADVTFEVNDKTIVPTALAVDYAHRRKGIATEMYRYAEKLTGLEVDSDPANRSEDGEKFWSQKGRPFGKS